MRSPLGSTWTRLSSGSTCPLWRSRSWTSSTSARSSGSRAAPWPRRPSMRCGSRACRPTGCSAGSSTASCCGPAGATPARSARPGGALARRTRGPRARRTRDPGSFAGRGPGPAGPPGGLRVPARGGRDRPRGRLSDRPAGPAGHRSGPLPGRRPAVAPSRPARLARELRLGRDRHRLSRVRLGDDRADFGQAARGAAGRAALRAAPAMGPGRAAGLAVPGLPGGTAVGPGQPLQRVRAGPRGAQRRGLRLVLQVRLRPSGASGPTQRLTSRVRRTCPPWSPGHEDRAKKKLWALPLANGMLRPGLHEGRKPTMARRLAILVSLLSLTAALSVPTLASAVSAESKVTVGSPATPYLPNGSNEPALAMDANHPAVLAAGSNDLVDNSPCKGSSCDLTPDIGISGIYFSFDSGGTWTQPTYSGLTAQNGTTHVGDIHTLPNYF